MAIDTKIPKICSDSKFPRLTDNNLLTCECNQPDYCKWELVLGKELNPIQGVIEYYNLCDTYKISTKIPTKNDPIDIPPSLDVDCGLCGGRKAYDWLDAVSNVITHNFSKFESLILPHSLLCYVIIYVDLDKNYNDDDFVGDGTKENPYNSLTAIPNHYDCYPPYPYTVSGILVKLKGTLTPQKINTMAAEDYGNYADFSYPDKHVCLAPDIIYMYASSLNPDMEFEVGIWYDFSECVVSDEFKDDILVFPRVYNYSGFIPKLDCQYLLNSNIECDELFAAECYNSSVKVNKLVTGTFIDCTNCTFKNKATVYGAVYLDASAVTFIRCPDVTVCGGFIISNASNIKSDIPPYCLYLTGEQSTLTRNTANPEIPFEGYDHRFCCFALNIDLLNWDAFFSSFTLTDEHVIGLTGLLASPGNSKKLEFPEHTKIGYLYNINTDGDDDCESRTIYPFPTDSAYPFLCCGTHPTQKVHNKIQDWFNDIKDELRILNATAVFTHIHNSKPTIYAEYSTISINTKHMDDHNNNISYEGYVYDDNDKARSISWYVNGLDFLELRGHTNNITINATGDLPNSANCNRSFYIGETQISYNEPNNDPERDKENGLIDETDDILLEDIHVGVFLSYDNYVVYTLDNIFTLNMKLSDNYASKAPVKFFVLDPYNTWNVSIDASYQCDLENILEEDNFDYLGAILKMRPLAYHCGKSCADTDNLCKYAPDHI